MGFPPQEGLCACFQCGHFRCAAEGRCPRGVGVRPCSLLVVWHVEADSECAGVCPWVDVSDGYPHSVGSVEFAEGAGHLVAGLQVGD